MFGAGLWGGAGTGSGSTGSAGVPLSNLIMPAYRKAGVTKWIGVTPSADMYAEAIPELNRMLAGWNLDGHRIYTTSISDPLPLNDGQKVYTIGPGGDFDIERPLSVRGANVLFPTTPAVRRPVHILDDDQWRAVRLQDVPGAPPYQLYYDGSFDEDGRGSVYLRFQPPAGYSLELYTWQALKSTFTDKGDIAVFPPGYEDALVNNLAVRLVQLNPALANPHPSLGEEAKASLQTLITYNTRSPRLTQDEALTGPDYGPGYGWLDGPFGQ